MVSKTEHYVEVENAEWFQSLDDIYRTQGAERVRQLLEALENHSLNYGIRRRCGGTTPYANTISADQQTPYPGDREIERRIKSIVRWNAMAMVVRANRHESGIGGHISTYASIATLFEVGFNHFFRAKSSKHPGDIVYFQGHSSPGVYARAFLEGRLSAFDLENFRRELSPEGGLASYPHPRLMPDFWQYPTVSVGLAPIMAIYQARFKRYLENRGLLERSDQKIWAFLGDGEMDEPESAGALGVASRESLDNLIFVINCNLQRLDGPVRGNGQIIQELESLFNGAGWNVIKVIWGSDWDPLFEKDTEGLLLKRMSEIPDGQYQKYAVSPGSYIRQDFFGKYPKLLELVKNYSDKQIERLKRGGHDPEKVYAAYKAAAAHKGSPTVILAQTIKGYGLGESGEGRNVTHQQKKLNEQELLEFRSRFGIPVPDYEVHEAPFYKPADESSEIRYLRACRESLGGYVPRRTFRAESLKLASNDLWDEFFKGTEDREVATTMVMVRLLAKLMKDPVLGRRIVPIVPDEARTFGMEALFRQHGIYSSLGQLYEPVDKESLLYYNEQKDGAILEEGITEAGCMSSFIAAGTAYAAYDLQTIPFFLFYSIFGCQRTFDLIWAAADAMTRGFLIGGISGRTTLAGEGLQHQDGHSHLFFYALPHVKAYDPAFAYEMAVIVREGLRRMFGRQENLMYYITMMNEFYQHPAMPEGAEEGILKGIYRLRAAESGSPAVTLFGSGTILNEVIKAQQILKSEYDVDAEVWSVTSYKELYWDGIETDRWNAAHSDETPRQSYLRQCFDGDKNIFVAASDYVKALPCSIAKWLPGKLTALGTDGFGRSDTRQALRRYFGVDAQHIVLAALQAMAADGRVDPSVVKKALERIDLDTDQSPLSV